MHFLAFSTAAVRGATWVRSLIGAVHHHHRSKERGAAMVEYSLLVALIAVVAIVSIKVFGEQVNDSYEYLHSSIEEEVP